MATVSARVAAASAAVLGWLAAGCSPAVLTCTDIGAPKGVRVTVGPDVAAEVTVLRLDICQSSCQSFTVDLTPGSASTGSGCSPGDPDQTCSASSAPDDSLVGFVPVPTLVEGEVAVSGVLRTDAGERDLPGTVVRAALVHPNGDQCPGAGPQASVRLTAAGLRA